MADETHNGWTNYATWRVNLELVEDYLSSIGEDVPQYRDRWETYGDLASEIAQYVEDVIDGEFDVSAPARTGTLDITRSYAQAFVADVNWYEIAEQWPELVVDHDHQWGPVEQSRIAGTVHRKCLVENCRMVSLDGEEVEEEEVEED